MQNCELRTARGADSVTGVRESVVTGDQVGGAGGDGVQGGDVDYDGVVAELEGRQQLGRIVRS